MFKCPQCQNNLAIFKIEALGLVGFQLFCSKCQIVEMRAITPHDVYKNMKQPTSIDWDKIEEVANKEDE